MDKKYFTKYLPVEGEINHGDKVFSKEPVFGGSNKENIVFTYDERIDYKTDFAHKLDLTKVNLFLCSRDIKVGDEIQMEDGDGVIGVFICKNLSSIILEKGYKVIGEISPDALSYVKEGEEFNEEEVQILAYNIEGDKP